MRRVLGFTKTTRDMLVAVKTLEVAGPDFIKPIKDNVPKILKVMLQTPVNTEQPSKKHKTSRNGHVATNLDETMEIFDDKHTTLSYSNHILDNDNNNISNIDQTFDKDNRNIPNEINTSNNKTFDKDNNNIPNDITINNNKTFDKDKHIPNDINTNYNQMNLSGVDNNQTMQTSTHQMNTRSKILQTFSIIGHNIDSPIDTYDNDANKLAADYAELWQILQFKTFKFLKSIKDREPSIHTKILPSHMVRTIKYSKGIYLKNKSRLTAGGNHEMDIDNIAVTSPTVSNETILIQLTVAVSKKLSIASIDYQGAFLNAPSKTGEKHVMRINKHESRILCKLDPTLQQYMQPGTAMFVQLEKTLYGLREAGKMWFDLLSMALINIGFQQCMHELPLFKRKNHEIISVHVDDLLITYSGNLDKELMDYFMKQHIPLKINHLTHTSPLEHLGIVIELQNDDSLHLSQQHYIQTHILNEYPSNHIFKTPAIIAKEDTHNTNDNELVDKTLYLKKLMRLYYVAARTRPDILTAVSYASTVMNPTIHDDHKLNRIIGYLRGTINMKMHIVPTDLELFGYFDASFANHTDFKSHSDKIIYLGDVPIWYKSTKQKMNTRASAHAELNTLYEGLDILLWARAILYFMAPDFNISQPTTVYQDNLSTMRIAQIGRASTKTNSRYINCRTYWIKDLLDNHIINLEHLQSEGMIADALASIRGGSQFEDFRLQMQIYRIEKYFIETK